MMSNETISIDREVPGNEDSPRVSPSLIGIEGGTDFLKSFASAFTMILVSELGDKSFFITAILAMRYSRKLVLVGSMTALSLMTILSALVGYATKLIPHAQIYTTYISVILFTAFGFKMFYDAYKMNVMGKEAEVEKLQAQIGTEPSNSELRSEDPTGKTSSQDETKPLMQKSFMPVESRSSLKIVLQAFTMTFLAECGDRSQVALIALATAEGLIGLCIGGILGHLVCSGIAVIGGKIVAKRISIKVVTIFGGIVFLVFAVSIFVSIFFSMD